MARLRDNDDDLLFQSGLYTSSPASISSQKKEADTLPTPGVYTRSSGVKTSSYRELINKDAERQYYESSPGHPESAYAEPPSFAPALSLSEPALKRRSKPVARRGEGSMARPSYSQPDHHLPHELDVLWSGTRSLFKEDRPPIVVFSLGMLIGIGLTSVVFLLLMNRPAALTATTLTNPDTNIASQSGNTSSNASNGIPLNQPAEQAVSQVAIKEALPETPGIADAGSRNSKIPTAGTRHLSLSSDGAIRASADEPNVAKPIEAAAPKEVQEASPPPTPASQAQPRGTTPSIFGIKLAWPSFKLPGTGNANPADNGAASAAPVSAPVQESQLYEVKAGDTLGSIGYHFLGDSSPAAIQRIQEANHLSSPDKLALGQKLLIPAK